MRIVKYYLPIALVVALLASCSNDDESVGQSEDILLGNSDVEVKLSTASGGITRASVESDANGLFELDNIGIYMLGTYQQNTNPAESPIDWRLDYNQFASWITNVEAQAVFNDDTTHTDIKWKDGKTRWYPIGNWYSYRFYGYYPCVVDYDITTEKGKVTINYYNLDGKTDIIWGRSAGADPEDAKEKYRYSARYFRQFLQTESHRPGSGETHRRGGHEGRRSEEFD